MEFANAEISNDSSIFSNNASSAKLFSDQEEIQPKAVEYNSQQQLEKAMNNSPLDDCRLI